MQWSGLVLLPRMFICPQAFSVHGTLLLRLQTGILLSHFLHSPHHFQTYLIHIFPQTFYSSSILRYIPKLAEEKAPQILSCVGLSKLGSLKHLIEVIKDRKVVSLAITMPKVNHSF